MSRHLILFGLSMGLVLSGSGCVSRSIRQIKFTTELPSDLPQELKDKFEVKEVVAIQPLHSGMGAKASVAVPFSNQSAAIPSIPAKRLEKLARKNQRTKKEEGKVETIAYPLRRPLKDPIWLSERLVYGISYFAVEAGDFSLEVLPYKMIGNRKVYHIRGNAVSSKVFSIFYRLNDIVETFLDYDGLFSHRFHMVLDETKQKRDALELYDSEKKQTYYWNRWHRKDRNFEETKEFAGIQAFPQDSMSALYYLRTVPLKVGDVIAFPVVSEGKTWEAICTVVRRENIDTPLGNVPTLVIKPETKYQGVLQKNGDSFLWMTDDVRRIPVRLEARVRIGTVTAALKKIEHGIPPEAQLGSIQPASIGQ